MAQAPKSPLKRLCCILFMVSLSEFVSDVYSYTPSCQFTIREDLQEHVLSTDPTCRLTNGKVTRLCVQAPSGVLRWRRHAELSVSQ